MTPQDFDYLRKFLRDRSGLVLAVEKQYLAESRLLPVARRNDMSTLDELIDRLKSHRTWNPTGIQPDAKFSGPAKAPRVSSRSGSTAS